METVSMLKDVVKNSKDVIIIESDEDEEQITSSVESNTTNNDSSTSNGVVNIVAVYSLVNTKEIDNNNKCDIVRCNDQEDTTLPKIVAVTSGIEVIHDDIQNENPVNNVFVVNNNSEVINRENEDVVNDKKVISEDKTNLNIANENNNEVKIDGDLNINANAIDKEEDGINNAGKDNCMEIIDSDKIIDENSSDYESCSDNESIKKSKPYKLPAKIHIKNRIRHIICRRYQEFCRSKHYPAIKKIIKKLPKKRTVHHLSIKRNVNRFNSALPVKIILDKKGKVNSTKCGENVRLGIQEQLKKLRAKFREVPKETSSGEESVTLSEEVTNVDTNCAVAETELEKSDRITEDLAVPCCSKSLLDPEPPQNEPASPESPSNELLQKNSGPKSNDISKYKSLKYKLIINDAPKTELNQEIDQENPTTPRILSSPVQSTSADTKSVDLVENNEHDEVSIGKELNPPDLSTVIKKLQNLRHCIGKIPEEEDILARLKSDRSAVQSDLPNEDFNEEINHGHVLMIKSKGQKTPTTHKYAGEVVRLGPVKIALPNGKLVKPKTLAEKRRLLRREFESEMRTKMQTNEQLLERQLLRQKSNNRRTESSDVRERLLRDDAPMTRANWRGLTELLPSEFPFRTQYMMVDGRYVKICGSRGGKKRFISPPPPVHLYRRRKTKTKPAPKKIDNVNIPRFFPGPLSKKHRLLRQPLSGGGEYCSKKLPKILFEVQPRPGKPLSDTCLAYMKLAFSNNVIDKNRATFAATALTSAKKALLMSESFTFSLPYRNGQERMLMSRLETKNIDEKPDQLIDTNVGPLDDETVVSEVLSDMFGYVETAFLANSLIKEDPDAKTEPLSPVLPKETKVVPQESIGASTRVKASLELRRLNVTVIKASERSSSLASCCKETHCRLGCVCASLKCLGTCTKRHCGNVDCMFECRCEFTHRLRQKRSLRQDTLDSYMDDEDMLELKDRVCSGLARVEAEFKHAAVVNEDRSVTLVDNDADKRKRCVKAPKRFDDFVYSDLPSHVPTSPVKKQEDVSESVKSIMRFPHIIPKEEFTVKKMEIRLHNLAMEDVEPWCMVHELYRCFCECMDAYGEPFGKEKRQNSESSTELTPATKQNSNSIKTLSRTIMLESGDDEEKVTKKKNWHVERFSTEEDSIMVKRKKVDTKGSFHGFPDASNHTMRRKSNDRPRRESSETFKRKRSSEDLPKEKEKQDLKKPRLQIKSPWDLNSMVDKMATKMEGAHELLREFAMSTKRVINSDMEDEETEELLPPELNEESSIDLEDSIRTQRESHRGNMRCARIDDPILNKIPSMIIRNRKRAGHQRRTVELAENASPGLLKHMNLLVKRSQMVAQNRITKVTTMPIRSPVIENDHSEGQNVTIAHNSGPPPLIPAPGVRPVPPSPEKEASTKAMPNITPKVVNMISSALPAKDQKTMSNVVNREIMRMLNQKGALDADFDLSKPWNYRFQCMQWLKMLTKYKSGEIKLWLEKTPEQSSTMALLTTGPVPPVNRCIDMSVLNAAAQSPENNVQVPKFASKIHADCKRLHDPKHKAQYVFMRAHQTHWTLEGVIERGQSNKNADKNQKKEDLVTVKPKAELYADQNSPAASESLANNRARRSKAPIFTDEKTALLNAELLKARVEIDASLVESKRPKEKKQYKTRSEKNAMDSDTDKSYDVEFLPGRPAKKKPMGKSEKISGYPKRNFIGRPPLRTESRDSVGSQEDASNTSDGKKPRKIAENRKKSSARNSKEDDSGSEKSQDTFKETNRKNKLELLTAKRPFTVEEVDKKIPKTNENNSLPDVPELTPIIPSKVDPSEEDEEYANKRITNKRSRNPIGINDDKTYTDDTANQSISSNDVPIDDSTKLEALPFICGKRYLFVSMNETFSLLTSNRNGYRVTYLQLASAIQTSIFRNVYVRLKFKQNDLNQDAHGIVFAVPWCKEGVFIGPYELNEQCMITKQIYHCGRLLGLSEYTRNIENREPKPVGYWMCYNGDDQKFVKAYNGLIRRLSGTDTDKKSTPVSQNETQENKKVLVQLKGTSPNSVLRTNLDKIRVQLNGSTYDDQNKEPTVMTSPFTKVSLSPYTVTKTNTPVVSSPLTMMPKLVVIRPSIANSMNGFTNTITKSTQSTASSKDVATIKLLKNSPVISRVSEKTENATKVPTDSTISRQQGYTVRLSQASSVSNNISPKNQLRVYPKIAPKFTVQKIPEEQSLTLTPENKPGSDTSDTKTHDISIESTSSTCSTTLTAITRNDKPGDGDENTSRDSDDEPELIIEEPSIEVIDLSSDSEEEDVMDLDSPGPRWLYCNVEGIGHLEVEVTAKKKLLIRMPMVSTFAEFENFDKARDWMNSILKKIIYFLPNSFMPTWKVTASFADVRHLPKINPDIFQGNYVIYKRCLLDLADKKIIQTRITDPQDYVLVMKYADHYISRYIKHALGLKFSSRLTHEQLADAANTEVKSIHEVESKLVELKRTLLLKRAELVRKFKALKAAEANGEFRRTRKLSSVLKHKNSTSPDNATMRASKESIVIDD